MTIYTQIIRYSHDFIFSIRKYKLAFLLSVLIGFSPFILKYINSVNTYESSFTVSYDELTRKIYGDRLAKINSLVQQNDNARTSTLLGISTKDASSIISVEGKNILGEELSKDMNTDRIPFVVKITVKDSSKIDAIQKGIVEFLETGTAYMVNKKKIKVKEIDDEIAYIDGQMAVMDSIKRKYLNEQVTTSTRDGNNNSNGNIFQFSYDLYKKKQDLLRKKEMPGTLQVVDDAIVSKSTNKSLLLSLIMGTALSFIVYSIIVFYIIPVFNYKEVN
jgi:hypothetical protein